MRCPLEMFSICSVTEFIESSSSSPTVSVAFISWAPQRWLSSVSAQQRYTLHYILIKSLLQDCESHRNYHDVITLLKGCAATDWTEDSLNQCRMSPQSIRDTFTYCCMYWSTLEWSLEKKQMNCIVSSRASSGCSTVLNPISRKSAKEKKSKLQSIFTHCYKI